MFNYDSVLKTLETWTPIGISLLSLVITSIFAYRTYKREKENDKLNAELQRWKQSFEIFKEESRKEDMLNAARLEEMGTRASIVPYFNLDLANGKIESDKKSLILQVSVVNIGKESATNVWFDPINSDKEINPFFKSKVHSSETYRIEDYLNRNYAMTGEEITFKIAAKLSDISIPCDFIRFRIRYLDLIGNVYKQEFEFGFMEDKPGTYCYNLKSRSDEPEILEE